MNIKRRGGRIVQTNERRGVACGGEGVHDGRACCEGSCVSPKFFPMNTPKMRGRFAADIIALSTRCLVASTGLVLAVAGQAAEKVRFTDAVVPAGGKNLVPNGSFETGAVGWSSLGAGAGRGNAWAPLVEDWGNFATLHGTVIKGGGAEGGAFLRIPLGGKQTPEFNFDYFEPVIRRELRPLAANVGWIEVTPGQPYTISVSMRASVAGVRGAFGVDNDDPARGGEGVRKQILKPVTLTTEWQRFSHTFTPEHPYVFVLAGPDLEREIEVSVDVDAIQLEAGAQATDFAPRDRVEIGIAPTAHAGVFTHGKPGALQIVGRNTATEKTRVKVEFEVTDYADAPVKLAPVTIEIPAGGTVEKSVSLPKEWQGFYRVVAKWTTAQAKESRLLRLAIVPSRTASETVVGVNHAYPTAELLGLAKQAGVTWHRDWSLKWQHIEPAKGQYRWDVSDPQVNRVTAQGLNLMAMIPFPSTEWNSTAPDLATIRKHSPRHGGGGQGDDQELLLRARWAWMPKDPNELSEFVAKAVSRYQDQIQVWEFLNEALFTLYSLPSEGVLKTKELKSYTEEDYFGLLRQTVPAIRAANPKARIMGGGMFPGDRSALEMVKLGLLDHIDILGVHDYPSAGARTGGKVNPPEALLSSMKILIDTMREHGGPKPLWMTEFSYFGTDDLPRDPWIPIEGLWSEPQLLSEKQVADYVIRYITLFLGRYGEKIFLHSGCTGSVNRPGTESCLFADGAVRKVFPALAVFTELLGAQPKFVGDRTEDGYAFAFETGKESIVVLWDPEEKREVRVPRGVVCRDIMGRAIKSSQVRLGASPVYWSGKAGKAAELLTASTPVR